MMVAALLQEPLQIEDACRLRVLPEWQLSLKLYAFVEAWRTSTVLCGAAGTKQILIVH